MCIEQEGCTLQPNTTTNSAARHDLGPRCSRRLDYAATFIMKRSFTTQRREELCLRPRKNAVRKSAIVLSGLLPKYEPSVQAGRNPPASLGDYMALAAHMNTLFAEFSEAPSTPRAGEEEDEEEEEEAELAPENIANEEDDPPPVVEVKTEHSPNKLLSSPGKATKEKVLLRSLLGVIDFAGTFVIPMHELYRENLQSMLRLGFVQRMDYAGRRLDYSRATANAIRTVQDVLRQAMTTAMRRCAVQELEDVRGVLGLDYMDRIDPGKYRVELCVFNHPSIIV